MLLINFVTLFSQENWHKNVTDPGICPGITSKPVTPDGPGFHPEASVGLWPPGSRSLSRGVYRGLRTVGDQVLHPLPGSCEQRPVASLRRGSLFNPHPHLHPLSGHFLSLKNEPHCLGSLFHVCTDLKNSTLPLSKPGVEHFSSLISGRETSERPGALDLSGHTALAHGEEH